MDYLLNAMHMDTNKLRDKLALDLWEQFALDQPAANYKSGALSYVELVQDGRYWGLYGLMNPIDGHALGLTEDDTMIKSATSANISRADIASVRRTLDGGDLGLSVRWPDTYTGDALWEPMLAYYERFWENPDESSFETLYGMLDVPNAVDCTLFLLTVAAKDNDFSNTYYVFRKTGSDQWKLKCIPWDLNVTFGFENDRDQNVSNAFRMALATELDLSEAMENFMRKNPKAVFDLLQTRYLELRNRFLTPEFLMENLGVQSKSIMDSGALGREIARWRVVENTADTSGLAAFIRARFAFLDEYFGTPYSEAKLDPVH